MKKLLITLFLVLLFFFFNVDNVKAFNNKFVYDITNFDFKNDNFIINGWAVVSQSAGNKQHNISPTFELQFVNNGNVVHMVSNSLNYSKHSSKNSSAKDFSQPFFDTTSTYPNYHEIGTPYDRASAIKDTGQHIYVNNHFQFSTSIDTLNDLLDKYDSLTLNIRVNHIKNSTSETVFGVTFDNVRSFDYVIQNIGIQEVVVSENIKRLENFNIKFTGYSSTVKNIIVDGRIQGSPSLGAVHYDCEKKEFVDATGTGFTRGLYVTLDNYRVFRREVVRNTTANHDFTVYNIRHGFNSNTCLATTNEGMHSWIPAAWVDPSGGSNLTIRRIPPPPPPSPPDPNRICDYDDALRRYCCLYPEDEDLCDELKKPDSAARSNSCSQYDVEEEFKYPRQPNDTQYGHTVVNNQACSISCQESVFVRFQSRPSVKAGMGFAYPVALKGMRTCAAAYKNVEWVEAMNRAVESAQEEYEKMIEHLEEASSISENCGSRYTVTSSVPSCPAPYTDNRTGLTCSCEECETCYEICVVPIPGVSVTYPCNHHPCAGETTISCPRINGLKLDYNRTSDDCRLDVCNNNRRLRWSDTRNKIRTQLALAERAKNEHNRQKSIISELNQNRRICDNWINNNNYLSSYSPLIQVSNLSDQTRYIDTNTILVASDNSFANQRLYEEKNFYVKFCEDKTLDVKNYDTNLPNNISNFNGKYCDNYGKNENNYRDVWVELSTGDIEYNFSNYYYIQRYTGQIRKSASSGYDAHGRYSYTDFFAMSGEYDFSLSLNNLGPNIPGISNDKFEIDLFLCSYELTNWIFPPEGDPHNDIYGSKMFYYRPVSLNNPFPNREARANWQGEESLINKFDTNPYRVVLTPTMRSAIRGYNKNQIDGYLSFDPENPYESTMLRKTFMGNWRYNK